MNESFAGQSAPAELLQFRRSAQKVCFPVALLCRCTRLPRSPAGTSLVHDQATGLLPVPCLCTLRRCRLLRTDASCRPRAELASGPVLAKGLSAHPDALISLSPFTDSWERRTAMHFRARSTVPVVLPVGPHVKRMGCHWLVQAHAPISPTAFDLRSEQAGRRLTCADHHG